jgi:hypothetical protein
MATWRDHLSAARTKRRITNLRPYCVYVRHLPRWAREIPETLSAEGIGAFRCPKMFGTTPAEATLSVYATDEADAVVRARGALTAAFVPTETLAFRATPLD